MSMFELTGPTIEDYSVQIGFNGAGSVLVMDGFDFRPIVDLPAWEDVARLIAQRLDWDADYTVGRLRDALRAEELVNNAARLGLFSWEQLGFQGCCRADRTIPDFQDVASAIQVNDNRAAKRRLTKARRAEFQKSRDHLALALLESGHDYTCAAEGCSQGAGALTVDHIVPLSRGGSDDLSNLRFLCRPCNSAKRDKMPTLNA